MRRTYVNIRKRIAMCDLSSRKWLCMFCVLKRWCVSVMCFCRKDGVCLIWLYDWFMCFCRKDGVICDMTEETVCHIWLCYNIWCMCLPQGWCNMWYGQRDGVSYVIMLCMIMCLSKGWRNIWFLLHCQNTRCMIYVVCYGIYVLMVYVTQDMLYWYFQYLIASLHLISLRCDKNKECWIEGNYLFFYRQ